MPPFSHEALAMEQEAFRAMLKIFSEPENLGVFLKTDFTNFQRQALQAQQNKCPQWVSADADPAMDAYLLLMLNHWPRLRLMDARQWEGLSRKSWLNQLAHSLGEKPQPIARQLASWAGPESSLKGEPYLLVIRNGDRLPPAIAELLLSFTATRTPIVWFLLDPSRNTGESATTPALNEHLRTIAGQWRQKPPLKRHIRQFCQNHYMLPPGQARAVARKARSWAQVLRACQS